MTISCAVRPRWENLLISGMLTHAADLTRDAWTYASGLRGSLRDIVSLQAATAALSDQLRNRDESFLQVVREGIYSDLQSPYRRLLLHAGYNYEDVRDLVRSRGLEAALTQLHDQGVYVSLDEFKGRAPIRRPGLEFNVSAFDFDNPLRSAHLKGTTGGSRGGGTRVNIDLNYIAHEAAGTKIWLACQNLTEYPGVIWRPGPPSMTGLRSLLLTVRSGQVPVKWFSPSRPKWNRQGIEGRALMLYTLLIGRLCGIRLPQPEHAPSLSTIVDFLSEQVRRGRPAQLNSGASEWVRICLAAEASGSDIAGTVFRGGGEPYTDGKSAVVERVGARGTPSYAMQEAGDLAIGCGSPSHPDDMHVMKDRFVILPLPVQLASGPAVHGLFHTTLLRASPKVMLNVESGDYGVMEERDCGCLWQQIGFKMHLHTVRSYEKLTSGSVTFMGSMLHDLLEEVLPARFGGGPLDYQLVEEEENGLPRVTVLASPKLGPLDKQTVLNCVVQSLSFADWSRRQAQTWLQNDTLRVERREPYATGAGKILPLHILGVTDTDTNGQ